MKQLSIPDSPVSNGLSTPLAQASPGSPATRRRRNSRTVPLESDLDDQQLEQQFLLDVELDAVADSKIDGGSVGPMRVNSMMLLTRQQLMGLSFYWFGWAMLWMPLLVIILPTQIVEIAGSENKGSNMSSILMLGSVVSLICLPLFGSLSDMSTNASGRRRPYMVAGGCLSTIALLVMGCDPPMPVYTVSFLILSVSNNMIIAPYSGLVPDIVPESQRGVASSWLGGMAMLGYLTGGCITFFITSLGTFTTLGLLNICHGISMWYTVTHTTETPFKIPAGSAKFSIFETLRSIIRPLYRHDFLLLVVTRFLTQMGIATVQEFLQFFISDAIVRPFTFNGIIVATSPTEAVSIMFLPMLLGALISSVLSGYISDAIGGRRKIIVYWSGCLMSVACLVLTMTRTFTTAVFMGGLFGLGYGAFTAVDWALVTDLLEDDKEYAKDMAVWGLALVLPNLLMPLVGGVLDYAQRMAPDYNIGYSIVFFIASIEFIAGSYFVKYIHKIK